MFRKTLITLISILIVATVPAACGTLPRLQFPGPDAPITLEGRVVGVHDGDTLTVLDANREQHKIRLLGIDAPELKQAFGHASKRGLSDSCYGRNVIVKVRHKDRYGRELGQVFAQGRDLNLEQVRAGLAWHYKAFSKEQSTVDRQTYAEAEEAAQHAQAGLWADRSPTPPWDYRRTQKQGTDH